MQQGNANPDILPGPGKCERAMKRLRLSLAVATFVLGFCSVQSASAQGSPAAGAAIFRTICSSCHTAVAGRNSIGPSLYGAFGRRAGRASGYFYSPAMAHSDVTWTEQNLLEFLMSPATKVPGTKMTFLGIPSAEQRNDVVGFLKTLGVSPNTDPSVPAN
jgi:cytochrome c